LEILRRKNAIESIKTVVQFKDKMIAQLTNATMLNTNIEKVSVLEQSLKLQPSGTINCSCHEKVINLEKRMGALINEISMKEQLISELRRNVYTLNMDIQHAKDKASIALAYCIYSNLSTVLILVSIP
jgi:hypothetical protein